MKGNAKVVWSAADYASNSVVQQTWARELIANLKLRGDERILDVGCGDGKVTAEMARAIPSGSAVGVDASPQMIEFASKTFPAGKNPNLEFRVVDARAIKPEAFPSPSLKGNIEHRTPNAERRMGFPLSPEATSSRPSPPFGEEKETNISGALQFKGSMHTTGCRGILSPLGRGEGDGNVSAHSAHSALFDVIFSNAALHWVDDHQAFLRGAASVLKPGGRLVVSCGGKGNAHDVFLALRPEMRLKRWRTFFRKMEAPYFFHSPEEYKKWLARFGFKTKSIKLAPKDATYPGPDGFGTWLRTTWLPYTQRVPEDVREQFITAVVERYVTKHPVDAKGLVHVRMVRLEIDAIRS